MEYKLFDELLLTGSLCKVCIIQSGGAIKSFLADNQVFLTVKLENDEENLELGRSLSPQISNY